MKNKALSFVFLSLHCGLMANPTNPQVSNGDVSFDASTPGILNIQADDRSIINWQDFSIQAGEITQFIQPDSSSAVLNRVIGGNASSIMGSLQANGKVYLINPNGVIFGKDSVVNTGALIASALDLPDQLFLQDGDLLFSGDSNAALVNFGAIQASNGDVILIGYQVENNGTIDAPNGVAAIAAGRDVLIRPLAEERIYIRLRTTQEDMSGVGIDNAGDISALQAELKADGNSFAKAINHSGSIEATGIVDQGGRVYLVSSNGNIEISGFIAAQDGQGNGGEVDFLAQNIAMSPDGVVNVDGGPFGNGGTVILFADHAAIFYGTISAEGGEMGGDGGFVEVSGGSLDFSGKVSTFAPEGKMGTLLLDPYYLTISNAPTTLGTGFSLKPGSGDEIYNGYQVPTSGSFTFTPESNLNVDELIAALESNNVTIYTNEYVPGEIPLSPNLGNIDILDDIIWNSTGTLSVFASQDLNVLANVINPNVSHIKLYAKRDINVGHSTLGYSVQVGSAGSPAAPGSVVLNAGNNFNLTPGSAPGASVQVGLAALRVYCDLGITAGGNATIFSSPFDGCYGAVGLGGANVESTDLVGNIDLNVGYGLKAGFLTLMGGSGVGCYTIAGHYTGGGAPVTVRGNITANVHGAFRALAGNGTGAFALCGYGSVGMREGSSVEGKLGLFAEQVTITGGQMGGGGFAYAHVGVTNGGVADLGGVRVEMNRFTVSAVNGMTLTAGGVPGNHAGMGVVLNNTTMANTVQVNSLSLDSGDGDITCFGSLVSPLAMVFIGTTSNPPGTPPPPPANLVVSNVAAAAQHLGLEADAGPVYFSNGDSYMPGQGLTLNVGRLSIEARAEAPASLTSTDQLTMTVQNDFTVKASTEASAGTFSFGETRASVGRDVIANDGSTGLEVAHFTALGNYQMDAGRNVSLNPSSVVTGRGSLFQMKARQDIEIRGDAEGLATVTNSPYGYTYVVAERDVSFQETFVQPSQFGVFTVAAGNDVRIGDSANSLSTEVSQTGGVLAVSSGGDFLILGGQGFSAHSILGPNTTVNTTVAYNVTRVGGMLLINGGPGLNSFGQLGTVTTGSASGNLTFNAVKGGVRLQAENSPGSYAMAGTQAAGAIDSTVFLQVQAPTSLHGNDQPNTFAQAGNRSLDVIQDVYSPKVMTENTIVEIPGFGPDSYAIIGDVPLPPVP